MLRSTSSTVVRRRPSVSSSIGRHAIEIVGAKGQRDLRELRAVQRPVHLDVRVTDGSASRASATIRTSSYPVVGLSTGLLARQRRDGLHGREPRRRATAQLNHQRRLASPAGLLQRQAADGERRRRGSACSAAARFARRSTGASAMASRPAAFSCPSTSASGAPRRELDRCRPARTPTATRARRAPSRSTCATASSSVGQASRNSNFARPRPDLLVCSTTQPAIRARARR